jgi:hypothetical protein
MYIYALRGFIFMIPMAMDVYSFWKWMEYGDVIF